MIDIETQGGMMGTGEIVFFGIFTALFAAVILYTANDMMEGGLSPIEGIAILAVGVLPPGLMLTWLYPPPDSMMFVAFPASVVMMIYYAANTIRRDVDAQ